MNNKPINPQGEKVTLNIWLCPDGVYRWTYEYNMLKNPTIIFTVWKVLGIAVGVVLAFDLLLGLIEGNFQSAEDWQGLGMLFLILTGIMLCLSIIAYLILASMYGWKYQVLFEMTEEYVRHIQMPKQFKKAQALGWVTTFVGALSGKPAMVGIGLHSSTVNTMTTELKNVAALKIRRGRNTIHVNQKLDKNQVYAEDADFDFVERFLMEHCINAKISGNS
jgi:hypothetical protein